MEQFEALRVLTQCAGSQRRFAEIVDVSEEQVSRWRAGKYPVPGWVVAMAELMSKLPRQDWPNRWTDGGR